MTMIINSKYNSNLFFVDGLLPGRKTMESILISDYNDGKYSFYKKKQLSRTEYREHIYRSCFLVNELSMYKTIYLIPPCSPIPNYNKILKEFHDKIYDSKKMSLLRYGPQKVSNRARRNTYRQFIIDVDKVKSENLKIELHIALKNTGLSLINVGYNCSVYYSKIFNEEVQNLLFSYDVSIKEESNHFSVLMTNLNYNFYHI